MSLFIWLSRLPILHNFEKKIFMLRHCNVCNVFLGCKGAIGIRAFMGNNTVLLGFPKAGLNHYSGYKFNHATDIA